MRKLLIAGLLVLIAAPVAAEDVLDWGVYGGFDAGTMVLDLRDFNDFLDPLGISDFDGAAPLVGGTFYGILGRRFHAGVEGHMLSRYQQGLLADAQFVGFMGGVLFGYDVVARPTWRVWPRIGLGGTALGLVVDGVTGDFSGIDVPLGYQRIEMAKNIVQGRLGVTADWTPPIHRDGNGRLEAVFSLTVGVLAPLSEDKWDINAAGGDEDVDVDAVGPDLNFFGGYVLLGVRFGGGIIVAEQ